MKRVHHRLRFFFAPDFCSETIILYSAIMIMVMILFGFCRYLYILAALTHPVTPIRPHITPGKPPFLWKGRRRKKIVRAKFKVAADCDAISFGKFSNRARGVGVLVSKVKFWMALPTLLVHTNSSTHLRKNTQRHIFGHNSTHPRPYS